MGTKYKVGDSVKFNLDLDSQLYGYVGEITKTFTENGHLFYYVKFELEYDMSADCIVKKVRSKQ